MLFSNYTTIYINNYNYKKINKEFGDKLEIKLNEELKIPIEYLSEGSGYKVKSICDFCGTTYDTEWRKYLKIEKNRERHCCGSKECTNQKRKETSLNKWGVDNPMKSKIVKKRLENTLLEKFSVSHYSKTDEFKEKIKETSLDKWGVEHYSKTDEYKEKIKKTSLERYSVDNPLKSEKVKNKIKITNLEKWGVDNYSKTDEFKDKIKETSLDKWGVTTYSKSEECKEKVKLDNIDKWGVDNPMKLNKFKNKVKETILNRFGVDNYTKTKEYLEKTKKTNLEKWGNEVINNSELFRGAFYNISKNVNYVKYIGNNISLFECDCLKNHEFEINSSQYYNRIRQNIPLCTICNPIGDLKSIKEKELYEFIKYIYNNEIIQSYRDGLEIDIYLPDLNIGFEFNGLYYHSNKFKQNNYHLNKTNYFKEKNIRIIHIWEDDWIYKRDILESQIKNWLGLNTNKIFARKCEVKEIKDSKIATKFLEENHIQGGVGSSLKLGLYYEGDLVSLMTFDHYEGRNKMNDNEWNINRFCNKRKFNVIGGVSKLFKYFLKNYDVKRVISYSDNDWSLGSLYEKLGFVKVNHGKIDYKYIYEGVRVHKSKFRKSKTGISESELNLLKIYDCGKTKWEFK
jgi:hypothetical protein